MTLVSTNESKDTLNDYEVLWNKIRDLIRSMTNKSGNYGKKYMKIKFNSDDYLPIKTLEHQNMVIVVRSVFHKEKYVYTFPWANVFKNKKCCILIELILLKVSMLLIKIHRKSVLFATIDMLFATIICYYWDFTCYYWYW